MRRTLSIFLLSFVLFSGVSASNVFAASTTIGVSPASGSFGKAFPVSVIIDGHGDKFNAAEGTVTLSDNLKLQDLVLGDCNFSFLKTPSVQDPSFAGVILSDSSSKCTLYTTTLVPVVKGTGTVTITKASVRRYGDAANILSSAQKGSYTLSATAKPPSVLSANSKNPSKKGLYTVNLNIFSSAKTPIADVAVVFSSVSKKEQKKATTNKSGTVTFTNVKPGIYDATVMQDNKKIGETIINVKGANHVLTLGINIEAQKNNPLLREKQSWLAKQLNSPLVIAGVLVGGMVLGIVITLLIVRRKK